jgi:tetratricopeptide (TPR) repeat protein/cold shock CspA family protein
MTDLDRILVDVRALATRGDHHTIVARYGHLDGAPGDETWRSTEVLFEVGRAYGMLGNEEKVELYLLRCAELAPRRAAVFHCAIGWYFQRKKKWTKALRWYSRALESFPTYHLCLFRRGYCLEKLHRPREASEALRRARAVWDEAAPDQRQRGRGVQVQVLFHLSRVLRDLSAFDEARDALEACQRLDAETDPPAIRTEHLLACRGELQLRQGDFDGALEAFQAARDLDSSSSYVWERIGRVHELKGDVQRAAEAYEHATALPRGAFAYLALGRFHTHVTRDFPTAAAALSEAFTRLTSAEPLVRVELAHLELACGRPLAALAHVERALACRREGGFAEGLRLASAICEEIGRPADAARHLEQLSHLAPEDAEVQARYQALAAAPPTLGIARPDPPLPPELSALAALVVDGERDARRAGIVERFFAEKGFGFIRYGDGQSLFFHVTQCEDGGNGIAPGTAVSFTIGHNPKKGKPQAEAVHRED